MKKVIIVLALIISLMAIPTAASADSTTVGSSAWLKSESEFVDADYRVLMLKDFFEKYNSPLKDYAWYFVFWADEYQIDWRLVPAISGVESTFAKHMPKNSFNAYGWANGAYRFDSWESSIEIVSKTLRQKYYDRGADSPKEIAKIYAPPSKTWAWKVEYFMNKIDPMPVVFDL